MHLDSYVEIQRAYYEASEEFIGCECGVRWDRHLVQAFTPPSL
jgi:hypothetical protein